MEPPHHSEPRESEPPQARSPDFRCPPGALRCSAACCPGPGSRHECPNQPMCRNQLELERPYLPTLLPTPNSNNNNGYMGDNGKEMETNIMENQIETKP